MKQRMLSLAALLALAACTMPPKTPPNLVYNGPESLLDISSEVVNLSVADSASVTQLAHWIERDTPSRAELYCSTSDKLCADAKKSLELMGVPTNVIGSGDSTATLIYERILTRDCTQRFIDRETNQENLRSPSFGCSVSANMVQHVSDKQEFVSPALSDNPGAGPAISAFSRGYAPRAPKNPDGYDLQDSLIQSQKSQ